MIGRDQECAELVGLVTGRGFRAGLCYGEAGVGKSVLLRAGLIPALAAQDIVALYCDDIDDPITSLARALVAQTGLAPEDGESAIGFLDRTVARTLPKQRFVFVLDHMERALARNDDELMSEFGDLFARVVTRSAGRGRFLFCSDSAHVHLFGVLEKRTGSLFPPTSRFELGRLTPEQAGPVLAHILEIHRVPSSVAMADALLPNLVTGGPVLPADLVTVAVAMRGLGLSSPMELRRVVDGGPLLEQLQRAWISTGARATGLEQVALALLGELARTDPAAPPPPSWLAARVGLSPARARELLTSLERSQLIRAMPGPGEPGVALSDPKLEPLIHELAAPALAETRRVRDLVTAKLGSGRPLTPVELWTLRRAAFAPTTAEEQALLSRTKRLYQLVGAAAAALPLVFLIIIYVAMSGHYYFDLVSAPDTDANRLVIRAGRPGLSAFDWLPGSFGEVIADPGLSRPMVREPAWQAARDHDLVGDLDGDAYAAGTLQALDPHLASLIDYAAGADGEPLAELQRHLDGPQDLVAALGALAPIARGDGDEVRFIEQALSDASPAVQAAALDVAAAAARRRPGSYREVLARTLASDDADLRRLGFAAARELGDAAAQAVFQAALGASPGTEARRELLAEVTAIDVGTTPSAATAVSILVNHDIPERTRQTARDALRRAFAADPAEASAAAAKLAGDSDAPIADRILALSLMREQAPEGIGGEVASNVKAALDSASAIAEEADAESLRAAALPVYARVAPADAAADLAVLLQDPNLSQTLRMAMARAWGEVARQTKEPAAIAALDQLVDEDDPRVRTAAAEAYGNVGRAAQNKLNELAKTARFDVASGAVLGLANSVVVGAPRSPAMSGIIHLWRRKGRPRRAGAAAFARMAGAQPRAAYSYLTTAVRSSDDDDLRVIGARGLCSAGVAGHAPSARLLVRSSLDNTAEVRRVVIECVADYALDAEIATTIAARLARDGDPDIRADAARALARVINEGHRDEAVTQAILRLVSDSAREVRGIAIRALAALGPSTPEGAGETLQAAYDRAGEDERLALLATARAVGASNLVAPAILDRAPAVRVAALDTAIATGAGAAQAMNALLTDSDPEVRRVALERMAEHADELDRDAVRKSLRLALRDRDPGIARLALTMLVRLGSAEEVEARLARDLHDRSEAVRVQATAAGIGLVERDPKVALTLLEPLLDDPSHDVRRALLPVLAAAYAAATEAPALADMLRGAERHAMRRLVATAAFLHLARRDGQRQPALDALAAVAADGPPLARLHARLGQGLVESDADAVGFLGLLVP
ncbi:HEAT repeat domain-containing protein [Haliangium sp.]|uniref:HEAT repeat domain-containing protein n=1 Tax=Haliangium sp. TaxID=2663208 RepID=UPI003D112A7C